MGNTMIRFFVSGIPVPKGSTKSFYTGGKVITTNANRRTKDWEMRIATEAQRQEGARILEGPIHVGLFFKLSKPKSARKKDIVPVKRPDLDKLVRAAFDALTGILMRDDSQVVSLAAEKKYALPTEMPGVRIYVGELP